MPAAPAYAEPAAKHWSEAISFDQVAPAASPKMYKGRALRQTPTWEALEPEHAKRLRGRPSSYKPEYCQWLLEAMAQGYSLSGFAGYIGVTRDHLSKWAALYPDFQLACARGKYARLRKWESLAIEVAETGGQGSQATMIIFGLKNMGSDEWKEKQEVSHSGQVTLSSLVESSMKTIAPPTIDVIPIEE